MDWRTGRFPSNLENSVARIYRAPCDSVLHQHTAKEEFESVFSLSGPVVPSHRDPVHWMHSEIRPGRRSDRFSLKYSFDHVWRLSRAIGNRPEHCQLEWASRQNVPVSSLNRGRRKYCHYGVQRSNNHCFAFLSRRTTLHWDNWSWSVVAIHPAGYVTEDKWHHNTQSSVHRMWMKRKL